MVLHLIGLGLSLKSISLEAYETIQTCENVYLEGYTVTFPYTKEELEKTLKKKIILLKRTLVEDETILEEAKKTEVALLIYGDPLAATTHTQLLQTSKEKNIKTKTYPNASVFTTINKNGLSLYKYGKTTSIPNWKEHTNKPTSFINYIQENKTIQAHSLILTDIGLPIQEALQELKIALQEKEIEIKEKIIIQSKLGTKKEKTYYETIEKLQTKKIEEPYCITIPGTLNHKEKEYIETITKEE
jgi:diphthine synthase